MEKPRSAPCHNLTFLWGISLIALGLLSSFPAFALESSTTGDAHGTQSAVGSVNMKVDALAALVSATINPIIACNTVRKFYAPADPRKDANGCVGVQDYDYNGTNNSIVNMTGSRSEQFLGRFINSGTGTTYNHGVIGQSGNNGYGIYGLTSTGWGGVFYGGTTGYGVLGQGQHGVYGVSTANRGYGVYGTTTISDGWAGVFNSAASTGGVSIDNTAHNANLCLNGTCTTSLSGNRFGGSFMWNEGGWCGSVNPQTGGCSCPSGFSASIVTYGFSHYDGYICQR